MNETKKLIKKVKKMDLGNPVITALVGLVIFYIGLKMFSGGMKSMGNLDQLNFFIHNRLLDVYWWYRVNTIVAIIISLYDSNHCSCCIWSGSSASSRRCSSWC